MIALDCSAAVHIVRGTPEGQALKGLLLVDEEVISTTLLFAELDNTFFRYVSAGLIDRKTALIYMDKGIALVDRFVDISENSREALSEAARLNHPAYDMFYLTIARRYGATLFTLDQQLIKLCEHEGIDCISNLVI